MIYFFCCFIDIASVPLCCDAQMIEIMDNSITMAAGVFGRCETCIKNLHKSICEMNCSPRQSDFLVARNKNKTTDEGKNGEHTNGVVQ